VSDVPGFPLGVGTPAPEKLAGRLVRALPDADREAGRRLAERIFAGKNSRSAAQSAYSEAAEALEGAAPPARLDQLKALAAVAGIRAAARDALRLGVARYLTDHPGVEAGEPWVRDEVVAWRDRGAEAIAAEAERRLAELEDWRRAAERTSVWQTRSVEYNHARMTLQSARTGSFGSAAGPFVDFLRDVGEPVDELEVS
jgi:hypothetical protein